jgi:hypothetical protein
MGAHVTTEQGCPVRQMSHPKVNDGAGSGTTIAARVRDGGQTKRATQCRCWVLICMPAHRRFMEGVPGSVPVAVPAPVAVEVVVTHGERGS